MRFMLCRRVSTHHIRVLFRVTLQDRLRSQKWREHELLSAFLNEGLHTANVIRRQEIMDNGRRNNAMTTTAEVLPSS